MYLFSETLWRLFIADKTVLFLHFYCLCSFSFVIWISFSYLTASCYYWQECEISLFNFINTLWLLFIADETFFCFLLSLCFLFVTLLCISFSISYYYLTKNNHWCLFSFGSPNQLLTSVYKQLWNSKTSWEQHYTKFGSPIAITVARQLAH